MDPEKLKKMQAQAAQVRIGGKGTVRRKKKVVHTTAGPDEKKVGASLRQCGVVPVPDIEEANIIKINGNAIHFNNPKLLAAMGSNLFVLSGHGDEKPIRDLLPGLFNHLGRDTLDQLQRTLLSSLGNIENDEKEEEEEVPTLVNNFDVVAKDEE